MSVGTVQKINMRQYGFPRVAVRPATIMPGGSGAAYIHVHEYDSEVKISADSAYHNIRIINITPKYGIPPFIARITINTSPYIKPGTYHLEATITDTTKNTALLTTTIPIYIIDNNKLIKAIKNIEKYRKLYKQYGIQYTILKILAEHKLILRFTDLKILYESIVNHRISNGTLGDLLSRLLKKYILIKTGKGYMINPKLDLETIKTIIDTKRAKNAIKTNKQYTNKISKNRRSLNIPRPVKRALKKAKNLLDKDYWLAVDFIAHVFIGIRKSGIWLLWFNDYFIYKEEKTRFFHYMRSPILSKILQKLGLRQGIMIEHKNHSSHKYIHDLYGSYANSRRIHYLLKQLGWFTYGKPLILEITKESILVKELLTNKTLYNQSKEINNKNKSFKAIIYSGEHIDEENELTYYYRPSHLY